ncbi:MAG: Ldh family oxidoreductase [Alphaproteobacteria bacterium]
MTDRYDVAELTAAVVALFRAAGMAEAPAQAVAEILIDADLLGYDTHGLQFVPGYLAALESGAMRRDGEPEIVADHGASVVLDADRLPGQWAMLRALELAQARLQDHPIAAIAVRRSANISCLATYVKRAADAGHVALLFASGPSNKGVAPHGGRAGALSTNPLAFAIPAHPHPILADTSTSATSNRAVERAQRQGQRLPGPYLVGGDGQLTDDPAALAPGDKQRPPGAILPAGGVEQGYKGFALSLLVEALASGLGGPARTEGKPGGNHDFLLLIDPARFAGTDTLVAEMTALADSLRATPPRNPAHPVRLPGDRAYARYAEQMAKGVRLHPEVVERLWPCFRKYGTKNL